MVVAQYAVASCAPIPRQGDWLAYEIAADGTFCTSDRLPEGEAADVYEYVYPDGHRYR